MYGVERNLGRRGSSGALGALSSCSLLPPLQFLHCRLQGYLAYKKQGFFAYKKHGYLAYKKSPPRRTLP